MVDDGIFGYYRVRLVQLVDCYRSLDLPGPRWIFRVLRHGYYPHVFRCSDHLFPRWISVWS